MSRTEDKAAESESPVPVGTVVDGYRIERIISVRPGLHTLAQAGGAGGEQVMLKLLVKPLEGKDLRRRAAKLADIQGALAHPHVLPLVGNTKRRDHLCLGGAPPEAVTLADRLRAGPLEPQEAVRLLSQVAGALEAARAKGLIHRGLTPAAIIVSGDEPPAALLTDFGITLPDGSCCTSDGLVEDADYLSPEEIRGEAPTAQSSVYSLACILVACLTGDPPYPYHRRVLALHAHLVEPPPRLSERDPGLPAKLDEAVARAMARQPGDRHASVAVLMRAVGQALSVEVAIPGPTQQTKRSRQPEKRESPAPARRREAKPATRPARKRGGPEPTGEKARPAGGPPAPTPKQARRERQRARRSHPTRSRRRRAGARRRAPMWAAVALVASTVAGFATGGGGGNDGNSPVTASPVTAEKPPLAVADSTKPVVAPAVRRLEQRRIAARRRLRAARRPAGQAAVARHLARTYRDTRRSLTPASAENAKEARLADQLQRVERAYDQLAAAARRGSRPWRLASTEVIEREQELELLLRTQTWS
jgi:serine/threonine-protein kinase